MSNIMTTAEIAADYAKQIRDLEKEKRQLLAWMRRWQRQPAVTITNLRARPGYDRGREIAEIELEAALYGTAPPKKASGAVALDRRNGHA